MPDQVAMTESGQGLTFDQLPINAALREWLVKTTPGPWQSVRQRSRLLHNEVESLPINDPFVLAQTILMMMEQGDHDSRRGSVDRYLNWLQHTLAVMFGKRNGWRVAGTSFGLRTLAQRKVFSGRYYGYYDDYPSHRDNPPFTILDHCVCYRTLDRRAAAIATQPYVPLTEKNRAIIQAWARGQDLAAAVVEDFPSWWFPGHSSLIVLTPTVARQ